MQDRLHENGKEETVKTSLPGCPRAHGGRRGVV